MILTLTTQRTTSPFKRVKVDYLSIVPWTRRVDYHSSASAVLYLEILEITCYSFLFFLFPFYLACSSNSIANDEDMKLMSGGKRALY